MLNDRHLTSGKSDKKKKKLAATIVSCMWLKNANSSISHFLTLLHEPAQHRVAHSQHWDLNLPKRAKLDHKQNK